MGDAVEESFIQCGVVAHVIPDRRGVRVKVFQRADGRLGARVVVAPVIGFGGGGDFGHLRLPFGEGR
ncbi:MAG TPA: hypothetical protein VEF72_07695 [Mycobacterium sp.]|nr:hypothetical protein [Mycobacterium sp.]